MVELHEGLGEREGSEGLSGGLVWGREKDKGVPAGEDGAPGAREAPNFGVHDVRGGEDGVDGGEAVGAGNGAVVRGGEVAIHRSGGDVGCGGDDGWWHLRKGNGDGGESEA